MGVQKTYGYATSKGVAGGIYAVTAIIGAFLGYVFTQIGF